MCVLLFVRVLLWTGGPHSVSQPRAATVIRKVLMGLNPARCPMAQGARRPPAATADQEELGAGMVTSLVQPAQRCQPRWRERAASDRECSEFLLGMKDPGMSSQVTPSPLKQRKSDLCLLGRTSFVSKATWKNKLRALRILILNNFAIAASLSSEIHHLSLGELLAFLFPSPWEPPSPWGEWAAAAGQMCRCVPFPCLPLYIPGFSRRGAAPRICIRSLALALQLCGKRQCSNSPSD